MMEIELRPYQLEAVDDLRQGIKEGHKNQLLVAGTGSGKSVIAAHLMDQAIKHGSKVDFLVDRIQLVNQISAMLDRYGIDHGVVQAGHWRNRPNELIQVCSSQSLERRGFRKDVDIVISDEAHAQRRSTTDFMLNTNAKVIGLTATPFSEGMGKVYTRITNVVTTNKLIEQGYLTPIRAYSSVAPDMKGAKIIAGEWSDAEIEKRGSAIIGDIVSEWVKKTSLHFGGPAKTIVFSATVAHGEEICRQFRDAGYNFQQISYLTDPEERESLIREFSKPDSDIVGLASVEALSRGFDVPDVMVGIGARPLRRSFSSHIQSIGRVMRIAPGTKKAEFGYALWLDHAGNWLRFAKDMEDLFENGVRELDDGEKDKTVRKEPTEKEKKEIVCSCGYVLTPAMKKCPACGKERVRKSLIEALPGEMVEVGSSKGVIGPNGKPVAGWMQDKTAVWLMLTAKAKEVAFRKGYPFDDERTMRLMRGKWKGWYGEWPNYKHPANIVVNTTPEFENRWRRDMIAWAKKESA